MKLFNTKKKIAAATLAGLTVLGAGVGALAFWTSTGTGSGTGTTGTSTAFTIATDAATGDALTPDGSTQTIDYHVTNPSQGVQKLNQVVVSVADPDGTVWDSVPGCSAADYSVGGEAAGTSHTDTDGLPTELAASATHDASVTLHMVNRVDVNQDGCKNAIVPLYFSAS